MQNLRKPGFQTESATNQITGGGWNEKTRRDSYCCF